MTVPLGILGAVVAAMSRSLSNDVYFTVALITITVSRQRTPF